MSMSKCMSMRVYVYENFKHMLIHMHIYPHILILMVEFPYNFCIAYYSHAYYVVVAIKICY